MDLSDNQIKTLVQKRIEDDPILSEDDIHIDVTNGVVVLKGYVKTALERYAAISDASVAGKMVNAEYLHIL